MSLLSMSMIQRDPTWIWSLPAVSCHNGALFREHLDPWMDPPDGFLLWSSGIYARLAIGVNMAFLPGIWCVRGVRYSDLQAKFMN